jgi:UDPglucose--hexose-1-phosphate uridylyltransferase
MGCSNPHPHCQIWAQESIPDIVAKEDITQGEYYTENRKTLLEDYMVQEKEKKERIVYENDHFICVVPFWAVWPFETSIVSKRAQANISDMNSEEITAFAEMYKTITCKYDNIFSISFPYSAGIHQAPFNIENKEYWHWHTHFYPPLFRSAEVKKFMVGYEMLAEPQRDLTAEQAADIIKKQETTHYLKD